MTATWPADLPQALQRDDASQSLGDGRIRTSMDTGPGKVRNRSTLNTDALSGSMIMTDTQLTSFNTFLRTTIDNGSLPFNLPAPYGGGTWLVRFRDMPVLRPLGIDWRVSISLDVLP